MVLFIELILTLTFLIAVAFLQVYGIIVGFKKKWYIGLLALLFPAFALVVGGMKLFFKKDILK